MADPELKIRVLWKALASLEDEPRSLRTNLEFFGEDLFSNRKTLTVEEVIQETCEPGNNGRIKAEFRRSLLHWDYATDSVWSGETEPNTDARRARIYSLLGIAKEDQGRLDAAVPHDVTDRVTVIAKEHTPWYIGNRRSDGFYWKSYKEYLRHKGWGDESLESLSESTRQVIERLADPSQKEAFRSKGLVVGYVQSGKTANFTGVIARAADAGYRLIIVLAGLTDLLRTQTQRRLDKELIGRELVDDDYENDADWDQFISHGNRPSNLGYFDWQRLTGPKFDYQSLKRGIDALEFERSETTLPFHDLRNLRHARAKLIVIKKNAAVFQKLIDNLRRIRSRLDDIPAMIIDDESDQASVNTKAHRGARSSINDNIGKLLRILPRAQYVGYTATPFANVFIDPTNAEDLFPRDFILSLPRPPGYMGVRDFYDLDDLPPEDPRSNRNAYIREVKGADNAPDNLRKAIDSFVLSGSLKLFRRQRGVTIRTPHHTMLVHLATSKVAHRAKVEEIRRLLFRTDYRNGPALKRLEELYEKDFARISGIKAPGMPMPAGFGALKPYIGACLANLYSGASPVLMVNSDDDAETPDFDGDKVWKILVGGAKLSRGYTIEGLTVSYYRRTARTADTLMQMGRWFGFREGFSDLCRLYIGTEEPIDKKGNRLDLYEAFGATCRDEEMFRAQLKRYASMQDRILPIDVPPLVPRHMLMPTAKNKMFNARVRFQNFSCDTSESTIAPSDLKSIKHNRELFAELIAEVPLTSKDVSFSADGESFRFQVLTGSLAKQRVLEFLKAYKWSDGKKPLQREIEFLEGSGKHDPAIDHWLFIAPLQAAQDGREEICGNHFSVFRRKRATPERVSVYSEPRHRILTEYASLGRRRDDEAPKLTNLSPTVRSLFRPRQAVFLYYTVKASKEDMNWFPGFVLQYPENNIPTPIQFGVEDASRRDAIVIPARTGGHRKK